MSFLVIFSLIVKIIGAGLEIGSQALISQKWSVETYGRYSFFVSVAEIFYSMFFSGVIKFNNYYIPKNSDITTFKKNYYLKYIFPIMLIAISIAVIIRNNILLIAFIAAFFYLRAMDTSSGLMSYGKYSIALVGEYTFGRIILLMLILLLSFVNKNIYLIYFAYMFQFIAASLFYIPSVKKLKKNVAAPTGILETNEARKKYAIFQSTEVSNAILVNTPVIIQFIWGGVYHTAIVSIVLIVRKLINFISGPTSKLYQPIFSKKYAENDKRGLADVYAQITRLQLCFMMPVFSFLLASPQLLLKVFNKELIQYGWLVQYTSVVFLCMILFGPLANFLAMTGNEKKDTISNWMSVLVMYVVMLLFRENEYFVILGFCAQMLFVTVYKFIVYYSYMGGLPMPINDYIKLGVLTVATILCMIGLKANLVLCVLLCGLQFIINFIFVLPRSELDELLNKIKRIIIK